MPLVQLFDSIFTPDLPVEKFEMPLPITVMWFIEKHVEGHFRYLLTCRHELLKFYCTMGSTVKPRKKKNLNFLNSFVYKQLTTNLKILIKFVIHQ